MYLKPYVLLITLILGWILIPPTVLFVIVRFNEFIKRKKGLHFQPVSLIIIQRWYWAYTFLSIAFAWSTVFLFYPLFKSLNYSFTDKTLSPTAEVSWIGFQNYSTLFTDPLWWKSIWVTVIFILGTLPYSVIMSLILASFIVNFSTFWQTFFKAALFLPGVIGYVVNAAILKWIFYPTESGFANYILKELGLISNSLTWFSDPNLALPTLIVMSWLGTNGIAIIIYCAALGSIPKDYYDAANIDGASGVQKFLFITCPLAKPATIYVVITGLIGGFQIFAPALLITGGGPMFTTHFVNYRIYRTFYYDNHFGMACAMSVILMLIIVTISLINYLFLRSDVEF